MTLHIRPETAADAASVHALLLAAFDGTLEVELLERLRRDGDIVLSVVAADAADAVIGHAAFIRLVVESDNREIPVVGFVPLAVRPDLQRRGIGTALVRDGLARLRDRAEAIVFVLGDPAYYGRFGFDFAAARAFASAYAGPNFMALRLRSVAPLGGKVRYPAAFTALG
jgi:putative acetyltransferase